MQLALILLFLLGFYGPINPLVSVHFGTTSPNQSISPTVYFDCFDFWKILFLFFLLERVQDEFLKYCIAIVSHFCVEFYKESALELSILLFWEGGNNRQLYAINLWCHLTIPCGNQKLQILKKKRALLAYWSLVILSWFHRCNVNFSFFLVNKF